MEFRSPPSPIGICPPLRVCSRLPDGVVGTKNMQLYVPKPIVIFFTAHWETWRGIVVYVDSKYTVGIIGGQRYIAHSGKLRGELWLTRCRLVAD